MATVYLAHDLRHERAVALKVLRPELGQALGPDRFLREIKTTAQLTHPHILPLIDSGDAGGTLFYVMPYVEGESLRDRLTREKQLPLDDALQIAREVADALSYAHAHGVVHRDIKPENILLQSGHAVVADFGIAKAIAAAGSTRLTETGLAVGTPQYMSPEQAAGSQDLDGRSDLYSLGCVLYEMLGGEAPYMAPTPQALIAKKLSEPTPRISVVRESVPRGVEAALNKALSKTPADRFATARELAEALGDPYSAARPFEPRPARRRLSPLAAGALAVAACAALGSAGWLGWLALRGGAPHPTSLAVLPLASFTHDSTQNYLVQGVHDALISDLQQAGLTVTGRTSVLQYAHSEKPIRQIARELDVDALIEGSVRRDGDSVEIALRLIDGRTEASRWQKTWPGNVRSIFALYHGVTREIAQEIRSTLSPQAEAQLAASRTIDPEAYSDFLQGWYRWQRLGPGDLENALEYFQRALARDSTFALAHAGVAMVWAVRAQMGEFSPLDAIPRASAAARRALALDSTSAEVWYVAALIRAWDEWDWAGAESAFQRALRIKPNYPDALAYYSNFLYMLGRFAEARPQMERAMALDPLNPLLRGMYGFNLMFERRYGDAVRELQEAVRIAPENPVVLLNLGPALHLVGRHEEALGVWRTYFAAVPGFREATDRGYAAGGWREAMRRGLAYLASRTPVGQSAPFVLADLYVHTGERDSALVWLERAYRFHDPNMPYVRAPEFDLVRNDPRYRDLLRRMRLPD